MSNSGPRRLKVSKIFQQFDVTKDGGLNREEMAALVVAVNPRVIFSDDQMGAILDEVFRTYGEFIDRDRGLTLEGLLRTYDDGAGDVDRDFDALGLMLVDEDENGNSQARSVSEKAKEAPNNQAHAMAWAFSPNNGIAYDDTWSMVQDLRPMITQLHSKKERGEEIASSHVYSQFQKELAHVWQKADSSRTQEEAFDAHMGIGRLLFDHEFYKESVVSFTRSTELKPTDVRPYFWLGNTLYLLGSNSEAKEAFTLALDAAEGAGNQWNNLIPQIHINLGVALEGDGMLLCASDHYKEAAIHEPRHYRALKLLGSALFGVGEYKAAKNALLEAIYLKPDYADAHCDLGSALHAAGDDEGAVQEFQTALNLNPNHVDALYNLGGLFKDMGRYQMAAELYCRVLTLRPDHWQAQLNKAVSQLGAGQIEDARKSLREAFKMTNRIELYDTITHLKSIEKTLKGCSTTVWKTGEQDGNTENAMTVDASRFRRATAKTTPRISLSSALSIRFFQKQTRLNCCDVINLRRELNDTKLPLFSSGSAVAKCIRKEGLERTLRRLLHFLKPETFQFAMKVINEKVLSVLDMNGLGRVDLGMFLALLSVICGGSLEKRKRVAFDFLFWRYSKNAGAEISRVDALSYIRLLHAIYIPFEKEGECLECNDEFDEQACLSFPEFLELLDEPDSGFPVLNVLAMLETCDQVRHGGQTCAVCAYPIIGPRFKEITANFSLCSVCYSEGKVPISAKQDDYCFKEYHSEVEAVKDRFCLFRLGSISPPSDV